MTTKKMLILLPDAESFPMEKTHGADAGQEVQQPSRYCLTKLTEPLSNLLELGYEVTFASPEGKEPQPEPNSGFLLTSACNFHERRRDDALLDRMKKENGFYRPKKFSEISDSELETFRGVLLPPGHAPLKALRPQSKS